MTVSVTQSHGTGGFRNFDEDKKLDYIEETCLSKNKHEYHLNVKKDFEDNWIKKYSVDLEYIKYNWNDFKKKRILNEI